MFNGVVLRNGRELEVKVCIYKAFKKPASCVKNLF